MKKRVYKEEDNLEVDSMQPRIYHWLYMPSRYHLLAITAFRSEPGRHRGRPGVNSVIEKSIRFQLWEDCLLIYKLLCDIKTSLKIIRE